MRTLQHAALVDADRLAAAEDREVELKKLLMNSQQLLVKAAQSNTHNDVQKSTAATESGQKELATAMAQIERIQKLLDSRHEPEDSAAVRPKFRYVALPVCYFYCCPISE